MGRKRTKPISILITIAILFVAFFSVFFLMACDRGELSLEQRVKELRIKINYLQTASNTTFAEIEETLEKVAQLLAEVKLEKPANTGLLLQVEANRWDLEVLKSRVLHPDGWEFVPIPEGQHISLSATNVTEKIKYEYYTDYSEIHIGTVLVTSFLRLSKLVCLVEEKPQFEVVENAISIDVADQFPRHHERLSLRLNDDFFKKHYLIIFEFYSRSEAYINQVASTGIVDIHVPHSITAIRPRRSTIFVSVSREFAVDNLKLMPNHSNMGSIFAPPSLWR